MQRRTKEFSLRVMRVVAALPRNQVARIVGDQLLRCGTSVGANYRSACRARSAREFCAKMGIVEEEADESAFWLELLIESGLMTASRLQPLIREAGELTAMAVASIKTTRSKIRQKSSKT
jgi:four helix bundle protein